MSPSRSDKSPTEAQYATKLLAALRAMPETWVFKVHGGPYQQRGIPDILGCRRGRLFALELKRRNAEITPLQRATLLAVYDAGGLTRVYSTSVPVEVVQEWLSPSAS